MASHEKPATTHQEQLQHAEAWHDSHTTLQERHPDWPKVNVEFYFSPHDNSGDTAGVAEHLKDADILLMESVSVDAESRENHDLTLQVFNKVSSNPKAKLDKLIRDGGFRGESDEPLLRGVHRTGKLVGSIDIGEDANEQGLAAKIRENSAGLVPSGRGYEDTLQAYNERGKRMAEGHAAREEIMADRFEGQLEKLLAERPELLEKPEIKVLITMGSAHTTLRHKFSERGIDSKWHFSQAKNNIYDYCVELIRTHSYGKEPSPELVKRAFTQSILGQALHRGFMESSIPTDEYMRYMRRYVGELTDEEMEKVFNLWNNRLANPRNVNNLMAKGEMPRLAQSAKEIRDANALYDERVHKLATGAMQH